MENRFKTFPDPFNNWIVWDLSKDDVAEADSQTPQFLSETRARELCAVLNQQEFDMAQRKKGWGSPSIESDRKESRGIK